MSPAVPYWCCCDTGGGGGDTVYWKMATACCPQGDLTDVIFVPATESCPVLVYSGSCYTLQQSPRFVNCDVVDIDQEPDDVVCLPDGAYIYLRLGDYHCAGSGSCSDPECAPCPPASSCCAGPVGQRCAAREPLDGETCQIHMVVRTRRLETGPDCGTGGGCGSTYQIQTTNSGNDTRLHGNGTCSWGRQVTFANGQRVQAFCDGSPTLDSFFNFTATPSVDLASGSPPVTRTCANAGGINIAPAPDLWVFGPELSVVLRPNITGAASYGIGGLEAGPNFENVSCRVGVIRGGKCVGVCGAWGTLSASHVRTGAENCTGQVDRVVVRAFCLMTTSKLALCQGSAPEDNSSEPPADPAAMAIIEQQFRGGGCRGCGDGFRG